MTTRLLRQQQLAEQRRTSAPYSANIFILAAVTGDARSLRTPRNAYTDTPAFSAHEIDLVDDY